ncbi:lysosomal acid phosphatase-like, partial [Acanthaster planci]|uniref:acid phosphatase n=1 Tax=Acanthaster planci TaxID=133434 RepID=A0A8B7YL85_ACAPL
MYRVLLVFIFLLGRCGFQPFGGLVRGERTRQLVNLLYRHGDRTPINIYPSDPHRADTWPEGLGQLTTLGMEMHYKLGQWLRNRYIDSEFLNATYNRDSVHVRSTDSDRTLMSAESDLAGFYPPQGSQIWKPGFDWMPIPVHTIPLDEDYLLKTNGPPCPVYDELKAKTKYEKKYKDLEAQYKARHTLYMYMYITYQNSLKCFIDVLIATPTPYQPFLQMLLTSLGENLYNGFCPYPTYILI